MEENKVLEKIYGEIKRLVDMAENSMNKYEEEIETVLQAKELDVWDEARMWLDNVFRDAIMQEIRESVPKMRDDNEELYKTLHRVAMTVRVKKKVMEYLSEDGILKLDEELSKMKKEGDEAREKYLKKIKDIQEGKHDKDVVEAGISGELVASSEGGK